MACRPPGRSAAGGLFPCGLYLAGRDRPDRLSEQAAIYDLLFRTAAETLLTIAADAKHLGAPIGATAVLHSGGSAMTHHPHVHMIVPGGGISLDGTRWIACRPGFLLPVRVLSRLFRRLFLTGLADAHAAGRLTFLGEIDGLRRRTAFTAYLAPLRRKSWFVYANPPFAGPEAVLAFLARYTHRVAISNSRLLALNERGVSLRYKDYRRDGQARYRTMTLAPHSVQGVPSHPPLRAARQRRLQGQYRVGQGTDRRARAVKRDTDRARQSGSGRRCDRPSPAVRLLRRPERLNSGSSSGCATSTATLAGSPL